MEHNRDFIYTIPSRILFDKTITDLDRKVYMIIRSFMDTTGQCYPSNNWFAEALGCDKRSIPRSVDRLIEQDYIKRIDQDGRRYLLIQQKPCPEKLIDPMTLGSPPHDPNVTPPMTLMSPNTSSNIINTNNIKTFSAPPPSAPKKFEYQETLFPVKTKTQNPVTKSSSLTLQQIIFALPFCIDLQVVEDWLKVRKTKRAPVTPTALKLLITELEMFKKAGIDPVKKFEEMVANGWSSIKFSWGCGKKQLASDVPYFENKSTDWIKDLGKTPFDDEVLSGF